MRRKDTKVRVAGRWGGVLDSFTKDQLAWIGAVAMAYNETEIELHRVFAGCVDTPVVKYAISRRINGTDGVIEIIRGACEKLGLSKDVLDTINNALVGTGFAQLKKYRDGVIHAQLIDQQTGVATAPAGRGQFDFVLLHEEALKGLYTRLADVKEELRAISTIVDSRFRLSHRPEMPDQDKQQHEQRIQDAISRCRLHQTHRLSLKQLPEFPEQPDMLALKPHKQEDLLRKPD